MEKRSLNSEVGPLTKQVRSLIDRVIKTELQWTQMGTKLTESGGQVDWIGVGSGVKLTGNGGQVGWIGGQVNWIEFGGRRGRTNHRRASCDRARSSLHRLEGKNTVRVIYKSNHTYSLRPREYVGFSNSWSQELNQEKDRNC